jgi:Glycosyl hydrolase family 99
VESERGPQRLTPDNCSRLACRLSGAHLIPALVLLLILSALTGNTETSFAESQPQTVLAYYYIWYTPSSWNRAKTDYPLLGRYSSDEREVMRQHIRWAQESGIDGFIVSWKGTSVLNVRLGRLIEVANEEDFKLAIIYQGLNFEREPLPIERIAADMDLFLERFADNEAFALFAKPLVIWSGTWRFSAEEVGAVTSTQRSDVLVLASERNVEGYRRLADLVDGNAYYWSSVNPETFGGYETKLLEMGEAVHARGGLWVAPAAPGFDARLVGGTSVVERTDGETLRQELNAAIRSSPDAVGLISWNEFSENTHVEPSENHGMRYLAVLADMLNSQSPPALDFDSSAPSGKSDGVGIGYGPSVMVALTAVILVSAAMIGWRRRRDSSERIGLSPDEASPFSRPDGDD